MNAMKKKMMLYIPTVLLGLFATYLQSEVLANGFDEKGLLIRNNPSLLILWGLTAVFLLGVLAILPGLGNRGTYQAIFPRCALSGTAMIAAGLFLGFVGVDQMVPERMGYGLFTFVAAGAMMLCGVYRLMGRKPVFVLDLAICLYYAANLLWSDSDWNANPQIQRYGFQLLAGIAAMLFCIHRGRCAAGVMDRKRLVYMGFAGIFLSFAAIPGAESVAYFLASGLWCAGGMCDLHRIEGKYV